MIGNNVTFVTDEGSNFKYGIEKCANWSRLNCACHVLNTVLKTVFNDKKDWAASIEEFIKCVNDCKVLVTHVVQTNLKNVSFQITFFNVFIIYNLILLLAAFVSKPKARWRNALALESRHVGIDSKQLRRLVQYSNG